MAKDELMSFFKDIQDEQKLRSATNFASKAIGKLCGALNVPLPDPLDWKAWNAMYEFPLYMQCSQDIVLLSKYCKKPVKQPVWKTFMEYLDDHPGKTQLGLVVRANGAGLWVIHNHCGLQQAAGAIRIRVAAQSEGNGVCLEPLPAFAAAVKLIWHF